MHLNPNISIKSLNSDTLIAHIQELTKVEIPISHTHILESLLNDIHEIDFKEIALTQTGNYFERIKLLKSIPESEETKGQIALINKEISEFKIKSKHHWVITIEKILEIAQSKKWGICKNNLFIYLFNGQFWSEIDKQSLLSFLSKAAEKLSVPVFDARLVTFVKQLFDQFIFKAYLPKPKREEGKVLVNLQNGTYEISLEKTILRPFSPSDFLTYQLPFEYDSEATAPQFQTFLDRVIPDVERQNILAEYIGYVFTHSSNMKLEKTLLLYGAGANGKSVFFEIVSALLGEENICNYSLQSLTDSTGYYRAKLANKLVNYASEINGKLETSIFKLLVSGEPVEARLPYGEPLILKDYAKLMFNCNELPKGPEHIHAFFRRFLIIPFDVTIPEGEQDTRLAQKIIESELAGVFNWALLGLRRLLLNNKFSRCEASEIAVATYKEDSDSVMLFLKEKGYQKSATGQIIMKVLFTEYRNFCIEDGYIGVNRKNFGIRLKAGQIETFRVSEGNAARLQLTPF